MQKKVFVLPSMQPIEAGQVSQSNLPAQLTPLIGRAQEVEVACALLQRSDVRLLTLTGPGGVGKTRLGLQVVTDLLDVFADGVFFVPLVSLNNPDLVIPTIAQTLGLGEAGDRPLTEHLKAYLQDKHLLLLLDNFEQVVVAAPLLTELLESCPGLKALVTSREVLRVRGEHEFPVLPLALPDLSHLPGIEALSQYAAVALFLQRALAIKPDFQMTNTNARAIAEICARLDGLPLAIELAAARVKLLPPQKLLARLESRLQLLTRGARDMPERQQTLRNTIKWSYDLLDAEEQQLFRRLSVFVSGCTLEAAESVCNVADGLPLNVLDGVTSLIDKSLLQQVEHPGDELRLIMLGTIREYGLECLAASGEEETTRSAHAEYYLALAEEAAPQIRGAQQAVWLERLEREHDNLRAALRWSVEHTGAGGAEMALRLGAALWWFWTVRGHITEGRQWLEQALSTSNGVSAPVRAKALISAGVLARYQSDYNRAATLCAESLALFRELGDKRGIAASINELAYVAIVRGEYAEAHAMYKESLALLRELGDKWDIADTLFFSANVTSFFQGDHTAALAMMEEGLVIFKELGDQRGIAYSLSVLGHLSLSQGSYGAARPLHEESLTVFKTLGDRLGIARSLFLLAKAASMQGDYSVARSMFEESLTILRELDDKWFIAGCLEELARVGAAQGQPEWAARLWGAAETLREAIGALIPPVEEADYERWVATARSQLGEEAFAAAWREGRIMSPEQALASQENVVAPSPDTQSEPGKAVPQPTYPAGLTAREVDVLRLVATGLTDAQVAEKLVLSPRTVSTHLSSIYNKLGVTSRSAATSFAFQNHLV